MLELPIIIRNESPTFKILNILILISIVLFIPSFFYEYHKPYPHYITLSFLILIGLLFFISLIRSFIIKEFREIGRLYLDNDVIIISIGSEKQIFKVDCLQDLSLDIYGYDGQNANYAPTGSLSDFATRTGNRNFVSFLLDDVLYRYEFYIKSPLVNKKLSQLKEHYKYVNNVSR